MKASTNRGLKVFVVNGQAFADIDVQNTDNVGRKLQKACRFAEKHLDERLSLAKVATIAGFERTYFSRLFKYRMGIGFSQWLRELRIAHAMNLLLEPRTRIANIGLAVGYGEISTFERNFRLSKGMSPSDFRNKYGITKRVRSTLSSVESFLGF